MATAEAWMIGALTGILGLVTGFLIAQQKFSGQSDGSSLGRLQGEIDALRSQNESDRALLKDGYEKTISELKESHKTALDDLKQNQANNDEALEERISNLSTKISRESREDFIRLAQENLENRQKEGAAELQKQKSEFEKLVEPMKAELAKIAKKNEDMSKDQQSLQEVLKAQMEDLSRQTQALGDNATRLSTALTGSSSARGDWGEITLRKILEMANLTKGIMYTEQENTEDGKRPDFVIKLPGKGVIPIDSKASAKHFFDEALNATDEATKVDLLKKHSKAIAGRINELASKAYADNIEGEIDFVIMFVPNDAVLSAAFEYDAELIEKGVIKRVFIATPTTLLAMLRTVEIAWRQVQINADAKQMAQISKEFYQRIATWKEHIDKVGKGLSMAAKAYNDASSSWRSRIEPSHRKLLDVKISDGESKTLGEFSDLTSQITTEEDILREES